MLFLAKFAGIVIMVWFYFTAKNKGESPIKWAVLGLIGYWIAWWIINLTAVPALTSMSAKSMTSKFIVKQIPALGAIAIAFLIRKKLLADASITKE
jgi:hypothetical protein